VIDTNRDRLASLAASLKENDAYRLVLDQMRLDALEALAACPATDADQIREHQATVRVIDDMDRRIDLLVRQPKAMNIP